MRVTILCRFVVVVAVVVFGALSPVHAEEVAAAADPKAPPETADAQASTAAAEAAPASMEAVVRGLYVETRVGAGYAVVGSTIPADATYPTLEGESEGLGSGSIVRLGVGYDLTDLFAIEGTGAMALVSTRRQDRVRDLALVVGGLGARLGIAVAERLRVLVSIGGGYAQVDNGVEAPEAGPAAFGGLGVEYYVHVRHFSVGLDLSVLAPMSPMRVFVSLAPQIKYSF